MSLSTKIISQRSEFDCLAPEWNYLLRKSAANSIFLTFEWLSTWLDTVYPQADLFVITVRDKKNNLVGVAPFYLTEFKFIKLLKYRYLRFIGDCHSGAEYPDILLQPGLEEAALSAINNKIHADQRWDCVWLANISGWRGSCERLARCFGQNFYFKRRKEASFSNLKLPASFDKYLENLSTGQRRLFLRQKRKIQKINDVKFAVCNQLPEIDSNLEKLFHLHKLRWQTLGQEGTFVRRPLMVSFYRKFAPLACKNNYLAIFMLNINGEAQAVQYGYIYDNTFYQLQEGFNPQGPPGLGNTLRLKVIEWCIDRGITDYDFLGGHTLHKGNWGSTERFGCHLFLGRKRPKNALLALHEIWPTGRFIKQGLPAELGKGH